MSRFDFMKTLESLLSDIPVEERNEALKYYNDYFDDAGVNNEDSILNELGSPDRIAAIIKADLHEEGGSNNDRGYFTEKGYKDTVFEEQKFEVIKPNEVIIPEDNSEQSRTNTEHNYNKAPRDSGNSSRGTTSNNNRLALIILLCIFAIPVGIPLVFSFLGIFFSIIVGVFALLFAFGIAGIVMVPVGIALIFIGLVNICVPFIGIAHCGVGLIVVGLGILFVMLSVWLSKTIFPAIIKGIVSICRIPFKNRSVAV